MYSGIRLVLDTLRVMIPVVTLLGSAPTYFLLWFVLRVITWLFYPREVFRRGDDYFYSLYQRAVLFFFENPFNAQVNFISPIVVCVLIGTSLFRSTSMVTTRRSSKTKRMSCICPIIRVQVRFSRHRTRQSSESLVDWIVANMLAVRQGSLGHIRYVLKSALKWIPLYGFYFQEVRRKECETSEMIDSCLCSTGVSSCEEMTGKIWNEWNEAFVK